MNEVNNSFGVGKEDEVEAWGEDWDGTEGRPGEGCSGAVGLRDDGLGL